MSLSPVPITAKKILKCSRKGCTAVVYETEREPYIVNCAFLHYCRTCDRHSCSTHDRWCAKCNCLECPTHTTEPEPEQEHEAPEPQYKYTRDDGTVKEFADRESYLEYKIGADANKWANKFKELEAKVNQGEQPQQTQPTQRPEELLFEESVLKNEEWSPVVQVMTKAFEKFYGLQSQELQAKFDALNNQFGELKMSATESAVRSEFGIDRATEQDILEKQPSVVRDSLAKLDPTARLAVIRQLKGQTEAATQAKPPMPRAVPPQQAHVESSARGEPDYDRANAVESKLWDMSESDRDKAFGKLFESSGIFK